MRSSFVNHDALSLLCTVIVSLFTLNLSASPSLHRHYSASSLIWLTPTSISPFSMPCVLHLCIKYFILEGTNGSHKFRHPSLQTRPRLQPRPLDMVCHQYNLTISCCLPRPETCRLIATSHFSRLQRSPFDLGSNVSLSTLRPHCYRRARKTRYVVVLVSPSTTGLSPAR